MKTLVLGGNGFMGSHLSRALADAGHEVRIFDRPDSMGCFSGRPDVEYVYGDFSQFADVERAFAGCEIVFHLLSTTLPQSSNEDPMFDLNSNLIASVQMLNIAHRAKVKKIIFASSGGAVYGVPSKVPIAETHPTEPLSSYGICKLAIEKYLSLYSSIHGLHYGILRIANPYGEGQWPNRGQGAVAVFAYRALRGETIEIWGDGNVIRDYLYVGDVTAAFINAMHYEGDGRIFNIGSGGKGCSVNELLTTLEAIIGRPINRTHLPARDFDPPVNVLDIERARNELGWEPQTPLLEGLRRTVQWLSSYAHDNVPAPACIGTDVVPPVAR